MRENDQKKIIHPVKIIIISKNYSLKNERLLPILLRFVRIMKLYGRVTIRMPHRSHVACFLLDDIHYLSFFYKMLFLNFLDS